MLSKIKQKKRALFGVVASIVVAGAALAYWTTTASDATGSGKSDGTMTSTLAISGSGPTGLTPGAQGNITISVSNSGSQRQALKGVTVAFSGTYAKDSNGNDITGCVLATNYSLSQPTSPVGDISVAPASGGVNGTTSVTGATLAMQNLSTNQDACQGATIPLKFSAQ